MNKKLLLFGVVGSIGMGAAAILPIAVSAQLAQNEGATTFVQQLAAKLGIDQATVQTAFDSVQSDMKAERDAKADAEIAQAVTDGKITQRQADILNGLQEIELVKPEEGTMPTREEMESMTDEEREAQRTAIETEMTQKVVDSLNAAGLNTNADEVKATREAAREANLNILGFGFHIGGPKGGMMKVRF